MKPKCNLTEEERAEILPKIQSWITDEEEALLRCGFSQYLFYWYTDGKRQTYCTSCGARNRGVLGKLRHKSHVKCSACDMVLTAAATGRYQYSMKSLAEWGKAAFIRTDEEGNLLILTAHVLRSFDYNNLQGLIDLEPKAKYYLAPGKVQMWERKEVYEGDRKWSARDVPKKTVGEGFANGLSYGFVMTDGNYLTLGMEKLQHSSFRYCAAEEYFDQHGINPETETSRYVISYLAQYALRPELEMVTKMRLRTAVDELVREGRTNSRYLNWKARTPAGFLKLPKEDAKLFLEAGMDLNELRMYRDSCGGMRMREYVEFRKEYRSEKQATLLLNAAEMAGKGFRAARKYADRFPDARREDCLREWIDYLDMAHRIGLDLNEETVAMPRDLHRRHDEAAAAGRYRNSEAKEKLYTERKDALRERYEFRTETLSVIVPENLQAIIDEGKTLHHCVGGYADRHAEGKTCILFVRKTRKPQRSFLTMELNERTMEIVQIHGYKNEWYPNAWPPRLRYESFLDSWLLWAKSGSRRDAAGRPILQKGIQTA